ncbi:hypothetical protein TSUD_392010 [Trifolium subterraneum]|uniref:Putative plant transposon protein domain-containing protein n=1 Tax=Trifolium subterraneum TaxID=3900 RepID=A0A2Z6MWN1_TRISU|nr:hypothetical protein TSUD_392010 [Trifolium subterraneum]
MSSKRVQKSFVANSNSDSEDFDFFVNIEAERRFNKSMSAKSFPAEQGFVFSLKDEELRIPEDFARGITGLGWKREVVVRGKGILFSEANINKFFNIHVENCSYEATLATISDEELIDVMKSMTMEGTDWMSKDDWTIKRMSLKPGFRVWYKFLKHSLLPASHNETVNKACLVLLHCITALQPINVGRVISQEIVTYSTKNEGMLYFPCLISALCHKMLVPVLSNDEVHAPTNGFNTKAIEVLMKGNTSRKSRLQLPGMVPTAPFVDNFAGLEKLNFVYCFPGMKHFASPTFPTEIIGEYAQEYMPAKESTPDKVGPSTKSAKKKKKKRAKKKKAEKNILVATAEQSPPKDPDLSNQRLPTEEQQSQKSEEPVVSKPTQQVSGDEPEMNSALNDGEKEDEEGKEIIEEEKKEDEKEKYVDKGSQSGSEGKGHPEKSIPTKTDDHAELTLEKSDAGVVVVGSSFPAANLATTDKSVVKNGEITTDVDPQDKPKKLKLSKAAQKAKADKSSDPVKDIVPEPSLSAEPVSSEVSKDVNTKKRKKELEEPTGKSSRRKA